VVALLQTIGMRDIRGRRVFPRLLYAVALHELDRLMHAAFALFVGRPVAQAGQFLDDLEERRGLIDLGLSALLVLATVIRAYALLLFSVAILVVALARI
jgi:hypothetical protein